MPEWLIGVLVWGVIVGFIAYSVMRKGRGYRRCREAFLARRGEPLGDQEFVAQIGIEAPHHRRFCIGCRRAVAQELGLPSDLIYPDDWLDQLWLQFDADLLGIATAELQEEIGREPNLMHRYEHDAEGTGPTGGDKRTTFGEFLRWYVDHWESLATDPSR